MPKTGNIESASIIALRMHTCFSGEMGAGDKMLEEARSIEVSSFLEEWLFECVAVGFVSPLH